MNKKRFLNILVILLVAFCLFPSVVFAEETSNVTITSRPVWSTFGNNENNLGYAQTTYYTKGYGKRETKYISTYWDATNERRLFCIAPGQSFPSSSSQNKVTKYSITTTKPAPYKSGWAIDETQLKKVLSCYYGYQESGEKYYSIIAAQAIIWELVSQERTTINATNILGGNYGTTYLANDSKNSLYELINAREGIRNAYQAILRCAARFNIAAPSWATEVTTKGANKQELTSYNDSIQTFSRTFSHGSKIEPNLFKYYTYQIDGTTADCKKGATVNGVTCSCDNTKCTFSTTKEISSSNPVRVTFKYTYKDDATTKFSSSANSVKYYVKNDYQSIVGMTGSMTKEFYLNLYTSTKPTYQIKIKKVDTAGKAIQGVKFDIYSDKALTKKVGTTGATNASGETTYTGLTSIGTYYVKEANTLDGFITNNEVKTVTVTASNKVGTTSYATTSFTNKYMHLKMDKKTLDENGKTIALTGDACSIATCPAEQNRENGPIFTITKGGKKVCVTQTSNGNYKLNSIAETCPENTTDRIKTCNGKFDIEGISAGTYEVTEVATACGMTLPEQRSKTVVVKKDQEATTITFTNGITGVVFNKLTENGNLLDGGKYSLQRKENGIYKDVLLKYSKGVIYTYEENLTEDDEDATYILETEEGTINIIGLPPGEYRIVEKQAPNGYEIIKDKNSTAIFAISDAARDDYYQVQLVNHKIRVKGSYDSAELVVTIITGRKVVNYALIIIGLGALLAALIFLRKKLKK